MITGKQFWEFYNLELQKQGNPFRIYPEKKGYTWATVNGEKSFSDANLSISIIKTESILQTHICIMQKKDLPIYDKALTIKDEIEKIFGEKLIWKKGIKGPHTRKIEKNILYDPFFTSTIDIIKQNIEIVKKFIIAFKIDSHGYIKI